MATPGRKPKSERLKVLQGRPGKRPLTNEPKPPPVAPECPDWLADEAKAEWRRVAPKLERLGLLTEIDRTALAAYCQEYARWVEAEAVLAKEGTVVKTEKGYLYQRPELGIARKALQSIKGWCAEFGLTPSSRARMNLPEQPEEDGLEKLLNGAK